MRILLAITLGLTLFPQALAGVITFTDVTESAGLAGSAGLGFAAAFADIDNDGDLDLMVWNLGAFDDHLYRNLGDGTFADLTTTPGYTALSGDVYGQLGCQMTDFDNDGDPDLAVAMDNSMLGVLLYRNDNTMVTEVSASLGLRRDEEQIGAAWADVTGDGFVDLYIGTIPQFQAWRPYLHISHRAQSFADEWSERGLGFVSNAWNNVWFDWEDDGDLDLFIGTYGFFGLQTENRLYQNDGTGHFTWASSAIISTPEVSTGVELGDFDGDGRVDLLVLNTVPSNQFNGPPPALNEVWRDNGDGTFTDIAASLNLEMPEYVIPNGTRDSKEKAIVADFDNDMDLDVFVVLQNQSSIRAPPSQLWLNGGGVYVERSLEAGITTPGDTRGCTCGDYNGDGFLDIFELNSGIGGRRHTLYRNNGNANHWLIIDPRGIASNRDAIGLKAWLTTGGVTQIRELYSTLTHPTQLHFGLGSNTVVDELTLRWPSGLIETYTDLPADQVFRPIEGAVVPFGPVGIIAH